MAKVQALIDHFTCGIHAPNPTLRSVGTEIETFFVDDAGTAITLEQSQHIFVNLQRAGWRVIDRKDGMVTALRRGRHRILYELGYPNIELSVGPGTRDSLIDTAHGLLKQLYLAAERAGAYPLCFPIYDGARGNYLAIPDKRDATWLKLDGEEALTPLAQISAVQFTFSVSPAEAIAVLNRLLSEQSAFLEKYPQDRIWRTYVGASKAKYRADRYGGPVSFKDMNDYCEALAKHAVVSGDKLVPFDQAQLENTASIDLFLRSIWWYFRLRRYGKNLCIEVRPIARRDDLLLDEQLKMVWSIAFG